MFIFTQKFQLYNIKSKSLNSREYDYNKKEENISFQSQPVGVLIDLDGLDDWLNKTTSKNNQLEQKWHQTEANKPKNNFKLNDKVKNDIV